MAKLKAGDMFVLTQEMVNAFNSTNKEFLCDIGRIITVRIVNPMAYDTRGGYRNWDLAINNIDPYLPNQTKTMGSDLTVLQKFAKAGIMDGDDLLTAQGQTLFLTWLLKEHGEAFKTEIIDPIVAEEKK